MGSGEVYRQLLLERYGDPDVLLAEAPRGSRPVLAPRAPVPPLLAARRVAARRARRRAAGRARVRAGLAA